jgi:hypothetical protein
MDDLTSRAALAVAAAVLAALAALFAPAAAQAAQLTATGTCFVSRQRMAISGTAFTPGAPVALTGDVSGSAQADAAGTFTTQIAAPAVTGLGPRTVTVTAVDRLNPANTATLRLKVVRAAFDSNLPLGGRPRETTTWRFVGFVPRRPIYAHFILARRVRGDYRFGVARGDCGTLSVRAPRIPGVRALRPGRWTLKLDQRMTYRKGTPGTTVRFRIARRRAASR